MDVYIDQSVTVNHYITHQFFDQRNAQNNQWENTLIKAWGLVNWLHNIAETWKSSLGDTLTLEDFKHEFPYIALEWKWEITDSMFQLLLEELKKAHKAIREEEYHTDYQLGAMKYTIGVHVRSLGRTKSAATNFLSILRSPMYGNSVLMALMCWNERETHTPKIVNQEQIVIFPTIWLYKIMHPGCCVEISNISLLIHSITSFAAKSIWPSVKQIEIAAPYPLMKKKLKEAARQYGFSITREDDNYYLPATDDNYMQLWRRKWATVQGELCSVCWSLDAQWTLKSTNNNYCGKDCAMTDFANKK